MFNVNQNLSSWCAQLLFCFADLAVWVAKLKSQFATKANLLGFPVQANEGEVLCYVLKLFLIFCFTSDKIIFCGLRVAEFYVWIYLVTSMAFDCILIQLFLVLTSAFLCGDVWRLRGRFVKFYIVWC